MCRSRVHAMPGGAVGPTAPAGRPPGGGRAELGSDPGPPAAPALGSPPAAPLLPVSCLPSPGFRPHSPGVTPGRALEPWPSPQTDRSASPRAPGAPMWTPSPARGLVGSNRSAARSPRVSELLRQLPARWVRGGCEKRGGWCRRCPGGVTPAGGSARLSPLLGGVGCTGLPDAANREALPGAPGRPQASAGLSGSRSLLFQAGLISGVTNGASSRLRGPFITSADV